MSILQSCSINKAKERAGKENLGNRVEFRVLEAYDLPFKTDTFDVVMTKFSSQFFDQDKAYREFVRVLKPGNYTGINELYKDEDIPQKEVEELVMAEQIFGEITQLPFKVHTPTQRKHDLKDAGLLSVQIHKRPIKPSIKEGIELFSEFGVFKFMKIMTRLVRYTLSSKIIRGRIKKTRKSRDNPYKKEIDIKACWLCLGKKVT